jgi:hypothetical protein
VQMKKVPDGTNKNNLRLQRQQLLQEVIDL